MRLHTRRCYHFSACSDARRVLTNGMASQGSTHPAYAPPPPPPPPQQQQSQPQHPSAGSYDGSLSQYTSNSGASPSPPPPPPPGGSYRYPPPPPQQHQSSPQQVCPSCTCGQTASGAGPSLPLALDRSDRTAWRAESETPTGACCSRSRPCTIAGSKTHWVVQPCRMVPRRAFCLEHVLYDLTHPCICLGSGASREPSPILRCRLCHRRRGTGTADLSAKALTTARAGLGRGARSSIAAAALPTCSLHNRLRGTPSAPTRRMVATGNSSSSSRRCRQHSRATATVVPRRPAMLRRPTAANLCGDAASRSHRWVASLPSLRRAAKFKHTFTSVYTARWIELLLLRPQSGLHAPQGR